MHTDDSDVTLNVCLGREFEASGLTFCGDMGSPDHRLQSFQYSHVTGRALMHLGRRRHGADDITSGHRVNLSKRYTACHNRRREPMMLASVLSLLCVCRRAVMWNWNKEFRATPEYRARPYRVEGSEPDTECVSYTHDRDYEAVSGVERPPADDGRPSRFGQTAWCPPPGREYPGFAGGGGRYRDRMLDENPNE